MDKALKMISTTFLALLMMVIVFDLKSAQTYKHRIKDALDISTKAAALQLDTSTEKLGQGIFDIDPVKGKEVFKEYFSENLEGMMDTYVNDIQIINTHSKRNYKAPDNKTYIIDCPTIFASIKYPYDGILIDKEINLSILAGSSLKNKNELKGN
ncbi:MAG: hypothetical protein ACLS2V_13040 [Clostridium paraputrificum]|uniref:hypothetical protein n=1 Tax=Clostridium sp. TaxID=1506 RepID=UPI0025C39BB2|nr:hypothetical protein [Clostridium sp.]MBS5928326.1 hypothetical protein [Clostridium sp.]